MEREVFLARRGVPGGQRGFQRKMRKEGEIVFTREKGEGGWFSERVDVLKP